MQLKAAEHLGAPARRVAEADAPHLELARARRAAWACAAGADAEADGRLSLEELDEASGGDEGLLCLQPDIRERREAVLKILDVLGEGGEGSDRERAAHDLAHAHAEEEHVPPFGEEKLG
jgi:hypothetical protein